MWLQWREADGSDFHGHSGIPILTQVTNIDYRRMVCLDLHFEQFRMCMYSKNDR